MPRGDGTGPAGMGPMTGRAAGFCAGYPVAGFANPIAGAGYGGWGRGGRGRGGGRGYRHGFYAAGVPGRAGAYGPMAAPPPMPQSELDALKAQSEYLEETLGGVKERIEELETEAKKK